jgi:acetylornithine deacetylase/succinyl-diaminopimelate desuccinylase-like protein
MWWVACDDEGKVSITGGVWSLFLIRLGAFVRFLSMLTAAAMVPVWAHSQGHSQDQVFGGEDRPLAREILQQLVDIDTTHLSGSTRLAAVAMREHLLNAGFPAGDLKIVGPNDRCMNLVVRYRGIEGSTLKPVLVIGHLDVVEAKRSDWTVEPFTLTEKDGYFYGRGTQDMKASDAAYVTSFILLKRAGWLPKRDIILALTADEETGGDNGVQWLLKNVPSLVRAEFAINPDTGGLLLHDGKPVELDLAASEKIYADFQLTVVNRGGHSARPVPDNAIYRVADALGRLERSPFPVELNPLTRVYLEVESRHEPQEKRMLISKVLGPEMDEAAAAKLSQDSGYNALMHTTCVATLMQAGEAKNALPATATANVNCRIMPGHSPEEIRKRLVEIVGDVKMKVQYKDDGGTLFDHAPVAKGPAASALIPHLMTPLRAVTSATWPGIGVIPEMSSGSSDSAYTWAAGIPTYGVSGMGIDDSDDRAHGRDERLSVSAYYKGVEFTQRLVKALGEPQGRE